MNSQESLTKQLTELLILGNKAGLYDAVDYVKLMSYDKECAWNKNVIEEERKRKK